MDSHTISRLYNLVAVNIQESLMIVTDSNLINRKLSEDIHVIPSTPKPVFKELQVKHHQLLPF